MLFTPNYTVSYKGVFHPAGKPFDIDDGDVELMAKHGTVLYEFALGAPPSEEPNLFEFVKDDISDGAEGVEERGLEKMTKDELLAYAAEMGYDHIKRRMTKTEILEALL